MHRTQFSDALKRAIAAGAALSLFAGCAASIDEDAPGSVTEAETISIDPDDLRGHLVVRGPSEDLDDWSPTSAPSYTLNSHSFNYDNDTYHVLKDGTHLASLPLGESYFAPEGTYTVVLNDTSREVTIERDATQTVVAGRIEVEDVQGEFVVGAERDWADDHDTKHDETDRDEWLFNTNGVPFISTGVGINVLQGEYVAKVSYQTHTKYFDVTVDGTETVSPADLRGYIEVLAPADLGQPNFVPTSVPRYTAGSTTLEFDNGVYHVLQDGNVLETLDLGDLFYGPEGTYTVVLNDTHREVTIVADDTVTVYAGRIEVPDVDGEYVLGSSNDWAGDHDTADENTDRDEWLFNTSGEPFIPSGTGVNVLPGDYAVKLFYQAHTKYFPFTVRNMP